MAGLSTMESPNYIALDNHFDELSRTEWFLTADAFIKFQVRRLGAETAGQEPMKKNLLKILNRENKETAIDIIDNIIEDTKNYMRYVLCTSELYVMYDAKLKDIIVSNAGNVMSDVKVAYLNSD